MAETFLSLVSQIALEMWGHGQIFLESKEKKLSTKFTLITEISRANSEGSNYDDGDEDDVSGAGKPS